VLHWKIFAVLYACFPFFHSFSFSKQAVAFTSAKFLVIVALVLVSLWVLFGSDVLLGIMFFTQVVHGGHLMLVVLAAPL